MADGMLEGVAGFILRGARIHIAPEGVMNTVHTQIHHHRKVPWLSEHEMRGDKKMFLRFCIDACEERLLVWGAKVLHVEDIATGHAFDLWLQLCGIGVLTLR